MNMTMIWRALASVMMVCGALICMGAGCDPAINQPPSIEDGTELDTALRGFHKNLRWARYEQAAQLVDEAYEPTFLARYEEYGEDLHITMLEVRDVDMEKDESDRSIYAIVEVEQRWYKEPNMTVKKDRFMERWERSRNGWRLTERMERSEWREREKARKKKTSAEEPKKEGSSTPASDVKEPSES